MDAPVARQYRLLKPAERRWLREQYIKYQGGNCWYCGEPLDEPEPSFLRDEYKIDWSLFPKEFQKYPVHLQHDHDTGLTEGTVHMYCNAVLWQYEGR